MVTSGIFRRYLVGLPCAHRHNVPDTSTTDIVYRKDGH